VDDVTVSGGTVTGFHDGISAALTCPEAGDRISRIVLTDNTWGVAWPCWSSLTLDRLAVVGANGIGTGSRIDTCAPSVTVSDASIDVTDPNGLSLSAIFDWGSAGVTSSHLTGGVVEVIDANFTISSSRLHGVAVSCSDANVWINDTWMLDSDLVNGMACAEF